jgi:acyl carrier protein
MINMIEWPIDRVRDFITSRVPNVALGDDQDIFALGFANSLFTMELVMFVEREFGLEIPNDELSMDNFRSVSAISHMVQRLAVSAPKPSTV